MEGLGPRARLDQMIEEAPIDEGRKGELHKRVERVFKQKVAQAEGIQAIEEALGSSQVSSEQVRARVEIYEKFHISDRLAKWGERFLATSKGGPLLDRISDWVGEPEREAGDTLDLTPEGWGVIEFTEIRDMTKAGPELCIHHYTAQQAIQQFKEAMGAGTRFSDLQQLERMLPQKNVDGEDML